VTEYW